MSQLIGKEKPPAAAPGALFRKWVAQTNYDDSRARESS
jgi:hypothetical protein